MDAAIASELLRAVEPMAIEAALEAERRYMELQGERGRIVELELQQAHYDASLAERRYAPAILLIGISPHRQANVVNGHVRKTRRRGVDPVIPGRNLGKSVGAKK